MSKILLTAGVNTEELLQYVMTQLDDKILDKVKVERSVEDPSGLASEPVTAAVLLTLAPIAAAAILRIIERWMENRRQLANIQLVLDGFTISDEAGKAAAALVAKHSDISLKHGPAAIPVLRKA